MRLPGIKLISEKDGERYGRQNAPGCHFRRQAAQGRQTCDQEEVGKAAEKKAEETIEIARDEPARPGAPE